MDTTSHDRLTSAASSIEAARTRLRERIAEITEDATRSQSWKDSEVASARAAFEEACNPLLDQATMAAEEFDREAAAHNSRFRPTSPTFDSALRLATCGVPLPDGAAASVFGDLSPAEMVWLSAAFAKNGDGGTSVALTQEAERRVANPVSSQVEQLWWVSTDPLGEASATIPRDVVTAANGSAEAMGVTTAEQ